MSYRRQTHRHHRPLAIVIAVEPAPTDAAILAHLDAQDEMAKSLRHVRTPEGRHVYDQPIGTVIVPDAPRMPRKPPAVIFDRDGTLASVPKAPADRSPGAWSEYNAALPFDRPVPEVEALLRSIKPGVARIMVSGRAEGDWPGDRRRRFQMQDWIAKYNLPIDELFMRSGGDMRRDSVVKEEMLVNEILEKYDVLYAVDDRPQVLEVWRRHGIPTMQVVGPDLGFPIAEQGENAP